MKRMIKLIMTRLLIITAVFVGVEPINGLKVEAAEQTIESDLVAMDEVNLKVEEYLNEYLKDFPIDDLTTEKNDRIEYITKKLEADHFTEEEIEKLFEIMAQNRKEEMITLVEDYLDEEPSLSKNTLISKLKENTYSQEEVDYGLESVDIDWKEQAVKASEKYINTKIDFDEETYSIISKKCLFQFLVEEKDFSLEEAVYGIEVACIDWNEQAFKQVELYLAADAYSKKDLMEKLISDEFSKDAAEYGVTQTGIDWREQAIKKVENHLIHSGFQSKKYLFSFLKQAGFTEEEIDYAINLVFKDVEEDVEEEVEIEKPSINTPAISLPERPLTIKPLEFISSHVVISAQAATNKEKDLANLSIKESSLTRTRQAQSSSTETDGANEIEVVEDIEDLEDPSLSDSPIFIPVVMVLIVGNLYLFQKM